MVADASRRSSPPSRAPRRIKLVLLVLTTLGLALSLIGGPYPREQWLQHAPTVLVLVLLAGDLRSDAMSLTTYVCVVLFFWLHILGARYIYSFVPYDEWWRSLTGETLSSCFGWRRNHYDRLVHFLFGTLFVVPFLEVLHWAGVRSRGLALMGAVQGVVAAGALYEMFEWGLSVVMAPDWAEAYNGQQGDLWDAQKDMTLALAGALLIALPLIVLPMRRFGREPSIPA